MPTDNDFGAGGSAVVLDLISGSPRHLVVGGGKDGTLYLLNGDDMGGFGDFNALQFFNIGRGIFATGAFWNNNFYIAGIFGPLVAYSFNPTTNLFDPSVSTQSATSFGFPGYNAVRLFQCFEQWHRLGTGQFQLLHQPIPWLWTGRSARLRRD